MEEDITSKQVAEQFGYSKRYFEKIFREYFEIPFSKYIIKLKMREIALEVLNPPNRPERTELKFFGYANSAVFSRAFKKEFGVPPSDFRKNHREIPNMPLRQSLFGTKIELEYIVSEEMTIVGYPVYIDNTEYEDIIEGLIESSAWIFDHPVEEIGLDVSKQTYGLHWHDEKLDYGLFYLYAFRTKPNEIVPKDYVKVTIPSTYYAVFSCKRPKSHEETAKLSRLLMRYVRKEWKLVNDINQNQMGWIYQRFDEEKIYVYFPILQQNDEKESENRYGIEKWTKYIDEHILEGLTPKKLGNEFGYSEKGLKQIFKLYYGMNLTDYITIREEYLLEGKKEQAPLETVDLIQYYETYKKSLKITFQEIKEIKAIAKKIDMDIEEANIPEMAEFWFQNDSPSVQKTSYACLESGMEDKVALWDEVVDEITGERQYEYVVGPVVENFKQIPRDMKRFTLVGGRYAVFETENESDVGEIAESFRMMTRCAFLGWVKENMVRMDWDRITFVRYFHQKLYFYIPIIK